MSIGVCTNLARLVIIAAAVLLGFGLITPCMKIIPNFGTFDSWIRLLKPSMNRPTEYSILSGMLTLMRQKNAALGVLLIAFSAVFPMLKLAVMAYATSALRRGVPAGALLRLAHHTGKFSMLDVLVLALIVVAIKGLPGSTEVRLGLGVALFAGSVILSIVASILVHKLERLSVEAHKATENPIDDKISTNGLVK